MEARLLVGRIGKPHGLGGEVYVEPFSDDPERFVPGATVEREDGALITIASVRRHRDRLLVSFEGVVDRSSAETLRGPLYVGTGSRRDLPEDEYWPDQLIGCRVVDRQDQVLGTVMDVVGGPAQDLLVLDGGGMIPMVEPIVVEVDVDAGRVVVDPPEGLL